jgi:DNA-binding IclR family transcriptional regulator
MLALAAWKFKMARGDRRRAWPIGDCSLGTVAKALCLLDCFSESRPQIGLSEFARLSGNDKATTRRLLVSLLEAGFVEQAAESRAYRLGPAVLRLARVREAHLPIEAVVRPVLAALAESTGETAHFSLVSGSALATIAFAESSRANRVRLEQGELIPFHATASGVAYLAFAPRAAERILLQELPRYTNDTVVDAEALRRRLDKARRDGFAVSRNGYEDGVFGLAAPVFDKDGTATGAIAVAAPTVRVNKLAEASIRQAVARAADEISVGLGAPRARSAA